jgi:hypothetical protein
MYSQSNEVSSQHGASNYRSVDNEKKTTIQWLVDKD